MNHVTLRFARAEGRLALAALPRLFGGLIISSALLAALLYGAARVWGGSDPLPLTRIAVVNEDDIDAEAAFSYLERFRSVSSLFTFTEASPEQAKALLAEGRVIAVLSLPQGTLAGTLNGRVMPVTVTMRDTGSLSGALFAELTRCGASLLASAQAAVYTCEAFSGAFGAPDDLQPLFTRIDLRNLQSVLHREALFSRTVSSATGGVSVPVFYGASLLLLFLLCLGTLLLAALAQTRRVSAIWAHMGLSCAGETAVRFGFLFLEYALLALFLLLPLSLPPLRALLPDALPPLSALPRLAPVFAFFAAYTLLCLNLTHETAHALCWFFGGSLCLFLCSGLLLPAVFLPETLRRAVPFLPGNWCHALCLRALCDRYDPSAPCGLSAAAFSVLLALLSLCAARRERRRL